MLEINILGLSYKTCPVEIRERLAVSSDSLPGVINEILCHGAGESVILSTCNRIEIYWAGGAGQTKDNILAYWRKKAGHGLEDFFYSHEGPGAALHLFRVASGLDSMVLGEPQILGQVKWAYQEALKLGATGRILNPLFQAALSAGKLVRTVTGIATGITSVSSASVLLAEKIFGDLANCRVMVLGAGKMAHSAARHFGSKKVQEIVVSNRTPEHALELAQSLGGRAVPWEDAPAYLRDVDVVLCSTASPNFILSKENIEPLLSGRKGRPLFLIDIAVPRDVDPRVAGLSNVYLYDIDDLRGIVASQAIIKESEAALAQSIIEAKVEKFWRARFGDPFVIPAEAGIQIPPENPKAWIPAFAGMTKKERVRENSERLGWIFPAASGFPNA